MPIVEIREGATLELTSPVSISSMTELDPVNRIKNGLLLHITLDLKPDLSSIYGLPMEQRLRVAAVLKDICRSIITRPKPTKEVDPESREKRVIIQAAGEELLKPLSEIGLEIDSIVPLPILASTPPRNMAKLLAPVGMFRKERKKLLIKIGLEAPITQSEFDNAFGVLATKLTNPQSFNKNP